MHGSRSFTSTRMPPKELQNAKRKLQEMASPMTVEEARDVLKNARKPEPGQRQANQAIKNENPMPPLPLARKDMHVMGKYWQDCRVKSQKISATLEEHKAQVSREREIYLKRHMAKLAGNGGPSV